MRRFLLADNHRFSRRSAHRRGSKSRIAPNKRNYRHYARQAPTKTTAPPQKLYWLHKNAVYDTMIAMALAPKEKAKIIASIQTHEKDTGSSGVQIAILTEEIARLTEHLKTHRKDNHSRRGLLNMVAQRKKLLDYLKTTNARKYNSVIKKLGLKR